MQWPVCFLLKSGRLPLSKLHMYVAKACCWHKHAGYAHNKACPVQLARTCSAERQVTVCAAAEQAHQSGAWLKH